MSLMPDMRLFDEVRRRRADAQSHKGDLFGPIGTALGAGIGFMIGGPPGALAGAQIGSSAGRIGEGAREGTLTPAGVVREASGTALGMMAPRMVPGVPIAPQGGGTMPSLPEPQFGNFPGALGFADGGQVPGMIPDDLATLLAGMNQQADTMAGPVPQAPEPLKPGHPTWELLAQVIPQIVSQLPAPRRTNSSNKTIGAWAPAIATAATLPTNLLRQRREAQNAVATEQYEKDLAAHRERATQAAKDLRQWALGKRERDRFSTPLEPEVAAGLKSPSWVRTYGQLDEWQQEMAREAADDARRDAANTRSLAAVERAEKVDEEEASANQYAEQIASLDASADPRVRLTGRSYRWAARVTTLANQKLKERGSPYNLRQLQQLYEESDRFSKSGNSQRFMNLRQSAAALRAHMDQFEDFYSRWQSAYGKRPSLFKPGDVVAWNNGLYSAARQGLLGKEAAADAAALEPVREALQNEIPVVLAAGYAPQEQQYKETRKMMADMFGPRAAAARIGSLKRVIETRLGVYGAGTPFRGGRSNPYLVDVSPIEGWREAGGESRSMGAGAPAIDPWKYVGGRK